MNQANCWKEHIIYQSVGIVLTLRWSQISWDLTLTNLYFHSYLGLFFTSWILAFFQIILVFFTYSGYLLIKITLLRSSKRYPLISFLFDPRRSSFTAPGNPFISVHIHYDGNLSWCRSDKSSLNPKRDSACFVWKSSAIWEGKRLLSSNCLPI